MADTDLPNGFGALNPPPRRVRPIASPFGMLAFPSPPDPDPSQAPGFNVEPDTTSPAPPNPMASLLASLTPSRQAVAGTLGAPVDALAWAAHRMGAPIPGDVSYGGGGLGNTGMDGKPIWAPGPNVPFSSQYFQNAFDNPPSLDAVLRAMRRPGLF